MLCLKCRTLWPAGSSRCGSCGGSFGGRLCPKGHPSPSSAARCVRCGSSELTLNVPCLSLRPVFLLLSLAIFVTVLRVLAANADVLVLAALDLASALFEFVVGVSPASALASTIRLALPLLVPFLIGWLAFERGKTPSRCLAAYGRLARFLARLALLGLRAVLRLALGPGRKERGKGPEGQTDPEETR